MEDEVVDLRRGVTRLARRLRTERPEGALSSNKIGVLARLYREGPASPGALAAAEHQRPQSLTRVFADLERAGLISRTRSATDQRQSVLALTPAGVAALSADMTARDEWLLSALSHLTDVERQVLHLAATLMDRLASLD